VRKGVLMSEAGKRMEVAIKSLPQAAIDQQRNALYAELKVLNVATVRCQGVTRLLGTSVKDGRMHLVMKLYEGSLAKQLEGAPGHRFESWQCLQVLQQVCRAVAELHAANIVIGDLKPGNILYDEYGQYVVADFGISRVIDSTGARFMPSSVEGSFEYMAPEQFAPEESGGIGVECDLWGLACTVVEMVSGEKYWGERSFGDIKSGVLDRGEHPPLPAAGVLPAAITQALGRCFARLPQDRISAAHLLAAVSDALSTGGIGAEPAQHQPSPEPQSDRHPGCDFGDGAGPRSRYPCPVGFDFGTTYSCVAVYRNDNDMGKIFKDESENSKMPSCVAFTEGGHVVGIDAKDNALLDPANTVFNIKRLLGRRMDDLCLQNHLKQFPFRIQGKDGLPQIVVQYKGTEKLFTPTEVASMIFSKMKVCAESILGRVVTGGVIAVPAHFNFAQRAATKNAGSMAGLNVIRIVSEQSAAARAYGVCVFVR